MIVAPGACHRQPQQAACNDINAIIDDIVLVVHEPATQSKKTECWQVSRAAFFTLQTVCGELRPDKTVVRHVRLKRRNHPVAVGPRPRKCTILKKHIPFGVSISRNVEPVSGPAFTVGTTFKQPGNGPVPGARLVICHKGIHSFCRGRQTSYRIRGTAQQGTAVSLWSRFQPSAC